MMRERTRTITDWEAFDGTPFDSAEACAQYETENQWRRLIGLTEEQALAAMNAEDEELSKALATMGYRCAATRRAKGLTQKPPPRPLVNTDPELPPPVGRVEPMLAEEAERHTLGAIDANA
jgi:hypothetical protein